MFYAANDTCSVGIQADAQTIFDELPIRDLMPWNALILGYANQCFIREVLDCFEQMRYAGMNPGLGTFVALLQASCGILVVHTTHCKK